MKKIVTKKVPKNLGSKTPIKPIIIDETLTNDNVEPILTPLEEPLVTTAIPQELIEMANSEPEQGITLAEEPVVAAPKPKVQKDTDILKVEVTKGTVGFGNPPEWYQKGETFETTRLQVKGLNARLIKIV